jgi:hypothetical protein
VRIVLQNKVANMKRKRAPGGGRKARAGSTSSLTFRIPDDLRRELELESNGSVSERLIWHLRRSINRKRDEERDPALQGLLLLIARLAEEIAGGGLIPNGLKDYRSHVQSQWRTRLLNFRAFKFAVKKLLDTLEEPPEPTLPKEELEQLRKKAVETLGGPPEFTKLFLEIEKSPEAKGAWVFGNVWTRFTNSHLPYPEAAQKVMRNHPLLGRAMEREDRDFQIARKALQLNPEWVEDQKEIRKEFAELEKLKASKQRKEDEDR